MAFGNNIQGQYPCSRPGFPDSQNAKPGLGERQLRSGEAPQAQTPQEALSHIDFLYKSGRMGDLAGLLRRSEVFREAWRLVQQSSLSGVGLAKSGKEGGYAGEPQGSGDFPVPQARSPSPPLRPQPTPEGRGVPAMAVSALGSGAAKHARPSENPSSFPEAALEAYRRQARAGVQTHKGTPRLSIRV
jgi:hypothetical protein